MTEPPRFLFDHHVNARAARELRESGVDVVRAAEVGLAEVDDADLLAWAEKEGRIVVTRNYRDFAPLVQAYSTQGIGFPGVLFLSTSLRQSDVGQHVRALREWIRKAERAERNLVENGLGWIG